MRTIPDGHGHVYHRAGSFAPGRVALDPLQVELDAAGDRAMTERFIADALGQRQPALAVLWLGEPDHIQHNTALGSPEHLAVLREADRHAGMAIDAVERRRAAGDEVLLIVGSDHGHETVSGVVDIEAELIAAGLKSGRRLERRHRRVQRHVEPDLSASRRRSVAATVWATSWHRSHGPASVIAAADLGSIGQAPHNGLAFAVSLKADASENEFGVPGRSLAAKPRWGKPDRLGCGQHGGLGQFEQSPVLLIDGPGFAAGSAREAAVHVTDLAPTHHAASRHSGAGDGWPAVAASAVATRAITGPQSPLRCWRKMRSDGYHGLSSRPLSQRQQLS